MDAGCVPNAWPPAWGLLPLLLPLVIGCVAQHAPLAAAPAGVTDQATPADGSAPVMQPGAGRVSGGAPTASFPSPTPARTLPGGEEPTPDKALPELRVEHLGMHVGGGKNDAQEKAPFHRALEQIFPAFLECYKLAEDPWAGGSFGVDLKIARAGGAPSAEHPRTRVRGPGFEACMLGAFGKAQFEKPKSGPTVISYSIVFTLGKGKR